MLARKQLAVRAFLDTVNGTLGVDFGKEEWKALKHITSMATETSYSLSVAKSVDALSSANKMADALNLIPEQRNFLLGSVGLYSSEYRYGTLQIINFISEIGVIESVNLVMRITGRPMAKDFLGRYMTVDEMWLIEKQQGERPGLLGGWRVVQPRNPEALPIVFSTLREAKHYVEEQPIAPLSPSRRVERYTGILTAVCSHRHINNLPRGYAPPRACPTCGEYLDNVKVVNYTLCQPYDVDSVEDMFSDVDES